MIYVMPSEKEKYQFLSRQAASEKYPKLPAFVICGGCMAASFLAYCKSFHGMQLCGNR